MVWGWFMVLGRWGPSAAALKKQTFGPHLSLWGPCLQSLKAPPPGVQMYPQNLVCGALQGPRNLFFGGAFGALGHNNNSSVSCRGPRGSQAINKNWVGRPWGLFWDPPKTSPNPSFSALPGPRKHILGTLQGPQNQNKVPKNPMDPKPSQNRTCCVGPAGPPQTDKENSWGRST